MKEEKNQTLESYFKGDDLASSTWQNKYAAKGEKTPNDTHRRLAKEFARIEEKYRWSEKNGNKLSLSAYGYCRAPLNEDRIFSLFKDFKYIIPGGSVIAGCGTNELVSLSNCFVIGSPEDSYAQIMKTRSYQAQLMKRRGGVGYDLSKLRPRGAHVNNAAKSSTGAASFMDVCSSITNEVAQNGRRGALMLSMSISHPDVEEFITKKQDLTKVTGANISVKVSDEFMQAVVEGKDYYLRYPTTQDLSYFSSDYLDIEYNTLTCLKDPKRDNSVIYIKRIRAKELWDTLMHCAWNTAEPGIIFEGAMHNYSPDGVYPEFKMISTNPCGEIPMGAYDSCRLIHLNLTSFIDNPFTPDAKINEEGLYETAYEAMRLADDLVDLEIEAVDRIIETVKKEEDSTELDLWSKIKDTATRGRRAGLGFTGLADAVAMLGLKYASPGGIKAIENMMRIIFVGELDSTIDMSIERGAFPSWDSEREKNAIESENTWYKFLSTNFTSKYTRMKTYGRRNISWSTVAPTGTVSIMAGCSSGIEPVFLPFYERKRKCMSPTDRVDYIDTVGEKYSLFVVVHPMLKRYAQEALGYSEEEINSWNVEAWREIYSNSPWKGSTAPEIDWHQRVKLQGVVQKYITHSISSTINLPKETTEEEIADIYIEAWQANNKGQTIYRDECREGVLNTLEKSNTISNDGRQAPKRPKDLEADYHLVTAMGTKYIVLVGHYNGKPYEVFAFEPLEGVIPPKETHKGIITKVKKGRYTFDSKLINISDLQLANHRIEEKACSLYASMLLRHGADIKHVIKTTRKVDDNIMSFASAMCRVLAKYTEKEVTKEPCPEEGCDGHLVHEGGCIHCDTCSYSKCS